MREVRTEALIDALAAEARPVRPLAPPLLRAAKLLAVLAGIGVLAVIAFGDTASLLRRYEGRELLMALEMAALAATAMMAVVGAYVLAIPGRSRRWLLLPLPFFAAWLLASGAGCWADLDRPAETHSSYDCFWFILFAGALLGGPLAWRLARARPIEPVGVAMLAGLGSAAGAAVLLQFFHWSRISFTDLAVHVAGVALIVAAAGLFGRSVGSRL